MLELISNLAATRQVITSLRCHDKRLDDAAESRETEPCAMETAAPDHWRVCSQPGVCYTINAHNRHHPCRREG